MHAQTGHTTIGINLEAQMRPALIAGQNERIERIAIKIRLRQNLYPLNRFTR